MKFHVLRNTWIQVVGEMQKKEKFEMSNLKKLLIKIENVEEMHQKICWFFYISKKNEILCTSSGLSPLIVL